MRFGKCKVIVSAEYKETTSRLYNVHWQLNTFNNILTPLHIYYIMITKKRMLSYLECWKTSNNRTIYDCYKKPSNAKIKAWEYLLKHFYDVDDGYALKILTYNTTYFTVGYLYVIVDYNTNTSITYFKIITKQNIQEIIVNVEEF